MEITLTKSQVSPMRVLSHIRKNHAMEHAAIHILTKTHPNISFAGYSLIKGFWIMGHTELEDIQKAVELAYARLKNGEKNLAVHPNCGTNIAMTGLCTASIGMISLMLESDDESDFSRFSALISAGMVGALAGRQVGPEVQKRLTTDANVNDLSITGITRRELRGMPIFFVETALH